MIAAALGAGVVLGWFSFLLILQSSTAMKRGLVLAILARSMTEPPRAIAIRTRDELVAWMDHHLHSHGKE